METVVVFPAPFGPRKPYASPAVTVKKASCPALTFPLYVFESPSARIATSMRGPSLQQSLKSLGGVVQRRLGVPESARVGALQVFEERHEGADFSGDVRRGAGSSGGKSSPGERVAGRSE